MAEDDLEYHITFPSPTFAGESDEFSEVSAGKGKEPVVILLGWAGCQDKHLAKYSAIYEQKGCLTIRYTAPLKDIMTQSSKLQPIARKILELLSDLSLEENPIFFHVFSNGGGVLYRYFTQLIHVDPQFQSLNVRGCIFDSCPSQRKISIAVKAVMKSVDKSVIIKYIVGLLMFLYLVGKAIVYAVLERLGISRWDKDDYWRSMKNDPSRWPQLFLFSKADEIVSYTYVQEFVKYRSSLGIYVLSQCWDDSPHVQHFRYHRESYMKQCYDFLYSCL